MLIPGAKCDYNDKYFYTDGIYIYDKQTHKVVDTVIFYKRDKENG